MAQTITDYGAFLTEARRALEELDSYRDSEYSLKNEEKRLERLLESEKKAINDSINMTVKKRVDQINSSYDQEISRGQDRLKKVRAKREKAKNQGMKERIAEETSDLNQENKELRANIRSLFREKKVPHICNSRFYYALFCTRGFFEVLILLLTLCLLFLAVPNVIYMLLPVQKPLYLAAIYFFTVLLFGGIYITISNVTKIKHLETLKEGRFIRDMIVSNGKKIHGITKSIRRDKNEAVYDLDHYDDDIARIELELSEVTKKKKEALNTFESVTKTILADEITENGKARLIEVQTDYDKTVKDLTTLEDRIKEKALYIADHYEIYLEKAYLKPDKINELSALIGNGQAKNLTEAIDILKSR